MAYPERKPIYDAYKIIVQEIIDSKVYETYAKSEIEELDKSILSVFRQIGQMLLMSKEWPKEK